MWKNIAHYRANWTKNALWLLPSSSKEYSSMKKIAYNGHRTQDAWKLLQNQRLHFKVRGRR